MGELNVAQNQEIKKEYVENKPERLLNKNYLLLLQGWLVSLYGSVVYNIAVNFWVMDVTGSSAIMGTLSAVISASGTVTLLFAGVMADRWDRKKIMVYTDFIRGIAIICAGVAAVLGVLPLWGLFAVGIISGVCGGFFNPAGGAVLPDLVPKEKLMKASSIRMVAYTLVESIANATGGILYVAIGAPIMFIVNGISYIISGISEMFITVPTVKQEKKYENENFKKKFIEDFKEGASFVINFKGLRKIMISVLFLNMIFSAKMVILLAMCSEDPSLGAVSYGFIMMSATVGMFIGGSFLSIVDIPSNKKALITILSVFIMGLSLAIGVNFGFVGMLVGYFIFGVANVVMNTIFNVSMQLVVPQEKRGRVFAMIDVLSGGFRPIGMVIGGVIAGVVNPQLTIAIIGILLIILFIVPMSSKESRKMISYDPNTQTLDDIY